jgi:dTMP kinase
MFSIVLEGIDGSGKSTQAQLLYKQLTHEGLQARIIDHRVKQHTASILQRLQEGPLPIDEICILSAGNDNSILPHIGYGVSLLDRFKYTNIACGLAFGLDKQWLYSLYAHTPEPQVTILYDLSIANARKRLRSEPTLLEMGSPKIFAHSPYNDFESFQTAVRTAYLSIADENNFTIINAEQPLERVLEESVAAIHEAYSSFASR